jgi:hypothetical protein
MLIVVNTILHRPLSYGLLLVIIEVSFKIIPEKELFIWDNPKSSPAPVKPVCVAAIYDWN